MGLLSSIDILATSLTTAVERLERPDDPRCDGANITNDEQYGMY